MISAFLQKSACDGATARRLREAVAEVADVPRGPIPLASGLGDVSVVVDGLVGRCWALPAGGRQITALLLPGDLFRQAETAEDGGETFVEALSDCRIARIPHEAFAAVTDRGSDFALGLRRAALAEEAMLMERLVGFARRAPRERLAHLLCELLTRQGANGGVSRDGYDLPIERRDLAEALGISVLNLNYLLQRLQAESLIRWNGRRMDILDVARLKADAGFDAGYLRLSA